MKLKARVLKQQFCRNCGRPLFSKIGQIVEVTRDGDGHIIYSNGRCEQYTWEPTDNRGGFVSLINALN